MSASGHAEGAGLKVYFEIHGGPVRSGQAPIVLLHAVEVKGLIPGARLAVLPGTTHMSIMDRGAWIAPMVAELIG